MRSDLQKLEPGTLVELFSIELPGLGGTFRFSPGTNEMGGSIIWDGDEYVPFPAEAVGFERSTSGQPARPTLTVANLGGLVAQLAWAYGDLVGSRVTRIRTLAKYLDASNFVEGNPTANPAMKAPDEVFYIDRKTREDPELLQFSLSSAMDMDGIKLPFRRLLPKCTWRYRDEGCGWTGTTYFDTQDVPVVDVADDACGHRISSCKCRFGQNAELPFGGFPGCGALA